MERKDLIKALTCAIIFGEDGYAASLGSYPKKELKKDIRKTLKYIDKYMNDGIKHVSHLEEDDLICDKCIKDDYEMVSNMILNMMKI
jgi:hypothetical protein